MSNTSSSQDAQESSSAADGVSGSRAVTVRLLDAAVEEFAESGFDAARVAKIARRAGLTTGAIYARWPSKRELLHAAIDHAIPRGDISDLREQETPGGEIIGDLGRELIRAKRTAAQDVTLEAFVSARRDVAFRAVVANSLKEGAARLAAIVAKGKADGSIDERLSTAGIVTFTQALGLGMHLVMASEHDGAYAPTADEWDVVTNRVIEAMTPRGMEPSGTGV